MLTRNIFTLLFFCFCTVSIFAEPRLSVQLDRSSIYEGESFVYQLVLSDASPIDDYVIPDTSVWTDFDVQPLGRHVTQQSGSSFTMIFKGQTISNESTSTYSTQFSYVLTPKRAGSLAVPLPKVTINGKVLSPQSFTVSEGDRQLLTNYAIAVRVIEPEDQDIVFISLETNRNRLYPLQPLELTIIIQIKGLPDRFADANPLSIFRQPPQLQIPWATEDTPRGFQPTQKLENWLSNLLVHSPQRGFAVNNYARNRLGFNDDLFNMPFSANDMFQKVPLQFSDAPKLVKRFDTHGRETTYWEYRFSRTFIPQELGNYSFGPVTLKGALPVVVDINAPNGITAQKIYVVAKPVSVIIVDVPQNNRPADYIAAFGVFRWEVNLTPHQARVGDPMTLTLRLSGQGSTANIRPIDLSANPDISANFRVHMPPTEEINERSCTFTYTIRPQKPGKIVFPPVPISVFDVNTERFVALQSLPIPLEITDSESIQSATLFGSISPSDAGNVQLSEGGLFANKTVLLELLPPITFVQWVMTISLWAGGYVIIAACVLLWHYQRANPKQQRRRGALNRAKSRLGNISATLRHKDSTNLVGISGELQGVFFGYIADRTDDAEQGMTTIDACRQLSESQVPESLINAIQSMLESLDATKYGGMDIRSLDELTNTASTLLQQLDRWNNRI